MAGSGCSSQSDAEPTVASVGFEPRLLIVADDSDLRAEPGPRDGAEEHDDGTADWTVPDGSVVELRIVGSEPHRIIGRRTPLEGGDSTLLVDTGELQPGDEVVVALTEPGDVAFTFMGSPEPVVTVRVVPAG
jgi:hypothetical protein